MSDTSTDKLGERVIAMKESDRSEMLLYLVSNFGDVYPQMFFEAVRYVQRVDAPGKVQLADWRMPR